MKEQMKEMLGALVGLARATEGNEDLITIETNNLALECLAVVEMDINIEEIDLGNLIERLDEEKRKFVPKCYSCASPCGRNNNYDASRLIAAMKFSVEGVGENSLAEGNVELSKKIIILKELSKLADCINNSSADEELADNELLHKERGILYRAIYSIGTEWTVEELEDVLSEVRLLKEKLPEHYKEKTVEKAESVAEEKGENVMIRKIIKIDESKCNGCGACAAACHEGAIEMIDGVAKLTREDYCDGLGDCLPACPTDAISFEEREAPAYDEAAVLAAKAAKEAGVVATGGPGVTARSIQHQEASVETAVETAIVMTSKLTNWPVQIKLAPLSAPYFDGANLLVAADCTAFAYANFHNDFMRNKVTLIGCPKLDAVNYAEKLTEIIKRNDIKSVTIVRMEVPCCGGLENAVKNALQASGKFLPWGVTTISTDGRILD